MENTYEYSRYHNRKKIEKTPEEKMADLKKAISDAGFETKETPEGDILILEK